VFFDRQKNEEQGQVISRYFESIERGVAVHKTRKNDSGANRNRRKYFRQPKIYQNTFV